MFITYSAASFSNLLGSVRIRSDLVRCLPSMSIDLVMGVCSLEDPVDASLLVRKKLVIWLVCHQCMRIVRIHGVAVRYEGRLA